MIIETLITNIEEGKVKGSVGIAKHISQIAHAGQRRDNGHSYYVHPRNCVRLFYDLVSIDGSINSEILAKHHIPYGVIEVAYLHDVVEDTELTHQDVRDIFKEVGEEQVFDEFIDEPLQLITHDKKKTMTHTHSLDVTFFESFQEMPFIIDCFEVFSVLHHPF